MWLTTTWHGASHMTARQQEELHQAPSWVAVPATGGMMGQDHLEVGHLILITGCLLSCAAVGSRHALLHHQKNY